MLQTDIHRGRAENSHHRPAAHVCVGLSGGVDSAASLLLLKQRGYRVSALFMKNWEEDDREGHCSAAEDLRMARQVCDRIEVPLHTVNFATEYWDQVFSRFLDEYRMGRTPNPDVLCNREVKFSVFLDHARNLGAQVMATGHYARIDRADGRYRLLKGRDPDKDQSYFLHLLDQSQLARTLFPLGDLHKSHARALARRSGLAPHDRKDSTGICFIGARPFRHFLSRYLAPSPGPIESVEGGRLGEHEGLMFYTIGQRQGLRIGGRRTGNGAPWYVAGKDFDRNTLLVVQGRDHPALLTTRLWAGEVHWVDGGSPIRALRAQAKIRYRQPDQACHVVPEEDSRVRVIFDSPQWAVAPGQSVVFYRDEECLGGGVIERAA